MARFACGSRPAWCGAALALAGALLASCVPRGVPLDDASVADAALPDPDAPGDCPLGSRRYEAAGACLAADPCFPADPCAASHRTCANDSGAAACGRCLDGFTAVAGACEAGAVETYVGPFAVGRDWFRVWDGARYRHLFVHGVNLGATPPGYGPRDFGASADDYARWLDRMRAGGVNAVRIYSLHPPRFYQALRAHNLAHPEAPIYLLQGVWLAEPDPAPASADLEPRTARFDADIAEAIDCLHGARTIAERPREAWGVYDADVSDWTLGLIVGHELLVDEVRDTDRAHPERTSYEGTTVRLRSGRPTECWIAARLDGAVVYEAARYGHGRPVAFSSWMEVDPLDHPTEGSASREDVENLDLGRIEPFGAPAGIFLSYHVYPYYPNFVSEDPIYRAYADELGRDSYRGLLRALRAHDPDRAILVAEYGVPTSWGRAHTSASGMHHGGLSEEEAGIFAARMLRDIDASGMAGGVYFRWEDGWWKRIWITNARAFPAERLRLWHDLMNASQSYGLLAFDLPAPDFARGALTLEGGGRLTAAAAVADAEHFHVRLSLDPPLADGETLTIGLDTYADDRGESLLPGGARSPRRSELALVIEPPGRVELRVQRAYDLLALQLRPRPAWSELRSIASDDGAFVPMEWIIAVAHGSDDGTFRAPEERFPIGALRARRAEAPPSSLDAVIVDGGEVVVRLPWLLLQFSDPSTRRVIDDDAATSELDTATTEGIALSIAIGDVLLGTTGRAGWPTWNEAPATTERLKDGAETLFAAMRAYPRWLD